MTQLQTARTLQDATTQERDPRAAATELRSKLGDAKNALIALFVSHDRDLPPLAKALSDEFADTQIVGCTTAGEVTPMGYANGSVTAVAFRADTFDASITEIPDLEDFELTSGQALATSAIESFQEQFGTEPDFSLFLIDGLSVREELVLAALEPLVSKVPLLGGSAGDGTNFGRTHILIDGEFRTDTAAVALLSCRRPFHVFKTQHFVGTTERLVVTGAESSKRIVSEINGLVAGEEYARAVGLEGAELTPLVFAAHPVVMKIGGLYYVRSIQRVDEQGRLHFFCAIEEGSVLTVARGVDMVDDLDRALNDVEAKLGEVEAVLTFDCILRRLESDRKALGPRLQSLFERFNIVGFSTYGEQFHRMHVNQTFTGLAIGGLDENDG
ncbi:MAG: FIST N-terminal domain-containing protein [Planctomycetota bacterium]